MINQVFHGDCLKVMKDIPDKSVDFILTDPPYDLDNHGGGQNENLKRKLTDKHIDFISDSFDIDKVFNEFERIMKVINMCIFCSNKQISSIMKYWEDKGYSTTLLVWKKPNPIPFANGKYVSDVEYIIYVRGKNATFNNIGIKEQSKVFEYSSPHSSKRIHPTEKPVELLERLIKIHSKKDDIILDCFSGSGNTAIASINQNRNYILIEILKEYYDASIDRILNHTTKIKEISKIKKLF